MVASEEWAGKSLLHELDDEAVELRRVNVQLRSELKTQSALNMAKTETLSQLHQRLERARAEQKAAHDAAKSNLKAAAWWQSAFGGMLGLSPTRLSRLRRTRGRTSISWTAP